jgi:hypothetical protein
MKRFLLLKILMIWAIGVSAQTMRVSEHFTLGYSFGKKESAPTLGYHQMLAWGKNYALRAGTGLRMTAYSGKTKEFVGATKTISNLKITALPKGNMVAFNIPLYFELHGKKGVVGANIDILGLSLGKSIDSLNLVGIRRPDSLSIKPTSFNMLLGRGTTNAEIFIGFKPQDEIMIKAGLSMIFSEYHAKYSREGKEYDFGRFRHSAMMPFISVVFNFER